jgi:predicted O-linked N-acetylglucosamine transferase (SPINDLY family)
MNCTAVLDNGQVRLKACRYGFMLYPIADPGIGRSLDRYGEFSEGEVELFRQLVQPGSTILEIGANLGTHTVFLAKATGPRGTVYAFEPRRVEFQVLCANVALNALGNVHARQAVAAVDSLDLPACDFIKVDAQAFEGDAIAGAERTLRRFRPLIYLENNRPERSAALIRQLLALDYRLYWHLPPLFNPQNYFGAKEDIFAGSVSVHVLGVHASVSQTVTGFEEITGPRDSWPRAVGGGPSAEELNRRGIALAQQGRLDEAMASFQRAVEIKPDDAVAHGNWGLALTLQGKLDEAVAHYRRALELKPDFADAYSNLGRVWMTRGQITEALACFRRALELKPDFAEAHNRLGLALQQQGKREEAAASYHRALQSNPAFAEAHVNLANLFQEGGDLDQAIARYHQALQLKPEYVDAHANLAAALTGKGLLSEAVACCRRALGIRPDDAGTHNNLGNALLAQGRVTEAAACYRQAVRHKPGYAEAHYNLGSALKEQGELEAAIACFRRSLDLKPDYPAALAELVHQLQHVCRWEGLPALSQQVIAAVESEGGGGAAADFPPFFLLLLPTPATAAQQLLGARRWCEQHLRSAVQDGKRMALAPARPRRAGSKITLGYLSADFHAHATAFLVAELLEKHDRGRFQVFGYSFGPDDGSPMRRRLESAFDRFADLKDASFTQSAQRIAADEVDILVDLKGYTREARPQILAMRPAPVQVNYLAYPGTMGAPFMDYILADDFVVPPDQRQFFTEKVVYLPGCYQVNDSRRQIAPQTPSRAECGLPEEGFVFCGFNNSYKITPEMFAVWMELLKAVPGSVLWLLEGNRFAPANLRREAEARQVAGERLIFAPRKPLPEHLARHRLADLFLDTFPVNAHTTASDALWVGCPVLTIAGETFVSRVAGSLLRTVGLPELVARSLDEYQAMALRLARDPELLAGLRSRLEANRNTSRLFDAGRFARGIEQAYLTMWEIHASGQPPRAFTVSETQDV